MPSPPPFRMALKKDAATYYAVAGADVLETFTPTYITYTPQAREYTPQGWKETRLTWERNPTWWGVFRAFATPYKFVGDGARILRYVHATQGVEGRCILSIELLDPVTLTYSLYYEGDVDVSTMLAEAVRATASIMEQGPAATLKAKASTPYEIEVLTTDSVDMELDGIALGQEESLSTSISTHLTANTTRYINAHQFTPDVGKDYQKSDIGSNTIARTAKEEAIAWLTGNRYFFQATIGGTVKVEFDLDRIYLTNINSSNYANHTRVLTVRRTDSSNNFVGEYDLDSGFVGNNLHWGPGNFSVNVPVNTGDRLTLIIGFRPFNGTGGGGALAGDWELDPSIMRVTYTFRNPTSYARGYRYHQVVEKLLEKIFATPYTLDAPLLSDPNASLGPLFNARPYNVIVSPADAVRGLANAKLKTTWADVFRDMHSRWGMGVGMTDNTIKIQPVTAFFDRNALITDLGEVSEFSYAPATEFMGNLFKFGQPAQNYDDLNGRDEANTTTTYASPGVRVPKTWDITSPWRRDMYGIETYRGNMRDKEKADAESDNDTFLFAVSDAANGSGRYTLRRTQNEPGYSATGLLYPTTAFNLELLPGRDRARLAPLIAALTHQQAGYLEFQTTDKNPDVVTEFAAIVTETGDEQIGNLTGFPDDPPFLPILFKFTASTSDALMQQMQATPYGYVLFTTGGKSFKGFPMSISTNPATHEQYECTLLAHPETDLQALAA